MLVLALAMLAAGMPQVVPVTDHNGWPLSPSPPATSAAREPGGEPGGFSVEAPAPQPTGRASPLLPVFRAVGTPADAAALGGVRATLRTVVYDHRGAVIGEREAEHQADLAAAARDRLVSPKEQVYGRDGPAVYALYHGLSLQGLEAEARDELAWAGLLLRVPWVFADPAAFTVGMREELLLNGRPMSRFGIAARTEGDAVPDRYELWCEPDTSEPRFLVLLPADPAARPCRVRLLDYRPIGNTRLPMRRLVEGPDGSRRLEIEVADVRVRETFPPRHFAPPPR